MKTIFAATILLCIWSIIAHFFPSGTLLGSFVIIPVFIVVCAAFNKWPSYVFVPFGFVLLLLNDFLIRKFGGGQHDDAGRGWMELSFYMTIISSTITLIIIKLTMTKRTQALNWKLAIRDISFVLVWACLAFLFFRAVSIHIR